MTSRWTPLLVLAVLPLLTSATWPTMAGGDWGELRYDIQTRQDRHLLAYDETGGGRIVEVFGDLTAARQIAILVPGTSHTLANYDEPSPHRLAASAQSLLAELRRREPDEPSAVIAWLGYDTPRGVALEAARSERAIAGAADLARLTHELPPQARISLVGHSYGTVVAAHAAGTARTANLVVLGSPGLDVDTAAELGTSARVWATMADGDTTALVPNIRVGGFGHGADPTSPGYGAHVFASGQVRGHSRYYESGSESLANIARIVLGRYDEVTTPDAHEPDAGADSARTPAEVGR